ncbi:helix-turn-helix domain-containing protein [Ilyobacter polytropus]|uniref:Helix-turn-helix domain protein n=1 Tax=Ilyobacter polytropus (strain ATCC 51220 / DSM 2926 / LMG 16218 / CuHBu1) TaxID=572544 RepID=E3HBJ1_ILYPC|nr:helix-turn-helix transcriptional regulator [Ilyobacter polytropus]ADO83687.1 helix-turn-helix domain protein [Ilyobacter polytropus DSM 2926]
MAILSPVEKLIALRKKYKINQKDLAGDQISRSHLAMIETGKNKFNENTAKILVENFNKIFKERNIPEKVKLEELMESKKEQIEKLKIDFLKKLEKEDTIEPVISDIESYASEYDIQTKITLYEKIGNIFFEKENFHRAASFYLRILNDLIIIRDSKTLGKVSLSLIRIYLQTENFQAAVDLENLIKSEIISFLLPEKSIILFNFGCIFDSLKDYNRALEYFCQVEEYISDSDQYFDVKNFQAISSADLGKYDNSISIYRSLMLKYKDINRKIIINNNLLYISRLENNSDKIKFYLRKCKKLIELVDLDKFSNYTFEQIIFEIGETSLLLNKRKDAITYFLKLCDEKTKRNLNKKFSSVRYLLTLFTKKDLETVKKIEKFYFTLLKREKRLEIAFDFIDFYMKNGLQKEVYNILNSIKPFSKF